MSMCIFNQVKIMITVDIILQLSCFQVYLNTGSYRFNLAHTTANKSCAEICRNKWFFRFIKRRSFFLHDRLVDRRDINFYYHFPSRTVAQLDYSSRKFWRAGIHRTAWPTCKERISGMCEWSPCAGNILEVTTLISPGCHEDYPICFRKPSNFSQTIRQIKSNLVDARGHDRVRHE